MLIELRKQLNKYLGNFIEAYARDFRLNVSAEEFNVETQICSWFVCPRLAPPVPGPWAVAHPLTPLWAAGTCPLKTSSAFRGALRVTCWQRQGPENRRRYKQDQH
jgi:hypothetical protein